MRISIIQTALHWQNPTANLAMLEEKLDALQHQTDVIVLPEMFTTGFSMDTTHAEMMNLQTTKWLKNMAQRTNSAIVGSFMVKENHKFFNRLCWVMPENETENNSGNNLEIPTFITYDKKHLFRMAKEHLAYQAGEKKQIILWRGWRFLPLVCYDLRFPVWSRNQKITPELSKNIENSIENNAKNDTLAYDALIYIANWPAPRRHVWNTLLSARAIENLAYCVGVNRVGVDGNQLEYAGDSQIVDFFGEKLVHITQKEGICTLTLDKNALEAHRQKFPAYLDADDFSLV